MWLWGQIGQHEPIEGLKLDGNDAVAYLRIRLLGYNFQFLAESKAGFI